MCDMCSSKALFFGEPVADFILGIAQEDGEAGGRRVKKGQYFLGDGGNVYFAWDDKPIVDEVQLYEDRLRGKCWKNPREKDIDDAMEKWLKTATGKKAWKTWEAFHDASKRFVASINTMTPELGYKLIKGAQWYGYQAPRKNQPSPQGYFYFWLFHRMGLVMRKFPTPILHTKYRGRVLPEEV